jgi:hypothetical protein
VAVCAASLALLAIYGAFRDPAFFATDPATAAFTVLIFLIAVELCARCLRALHTVPTRYTFFGGLAVAGILVANHSGIPVIVLGAVLGIGLGIRLRRNADLFMPLDQATQVLGPFVLAFVLARTNIAGLLALHASHWALLLTFALAAWAGKTLGGMLGSRATGTPFRDWSEIYPQGLYAAMLLPSLYPHHLFLLHPAPGGTLQAAYLMVSGILAVAVLRPAQRAADGWLTRQTVARRKRAAASGGIGLT